MVNRVISLYEVSRSIESHCIDFYKACVLKTNQFSTKYILQKMIEHHKKHLGIIKTNLSNEHEKIFAPDLLENYQQHFSNSESINSFDIVNLNFVEVTKLAIGLINLQIDFYRQMAEDLEEVSTKKSIDNIIELKTNYIRNLETEFDRLSYK